MLVSHDGNIAHAELHIGAHPTDAQKLVGMATTVRDAGSKITLGVTEILNATTASAAKARRSTTALPCGTSRTWRHTR